MQIIKFVLVLATLLAFLALEDAFPKERGEVLFSETLKLYKELIVDPKKSKDKDIWETIAKAFYSVYSSYPNSKKAPNSLFLSGRVYEEIGNRFNSNEDYETAIKISREFVNNYPKSNLTDDAQIRIARIYEKTGNKTQAYIEYKKIVDDLPKGDMIFAAKNKVGELSPFEPKKKQEIKRPYTGPRITKIRHWSTDNYSRVVIHLNQEMPYKPKFLKADPKLGTPPRLYVDIKGTTIDNSLYVEPITKGLLRQIKFGKNTSNIVRVVLYIKSFEQYKVFSLDNPYRIVMDIEGKGAEPDRIFAKDVKTKTVKKSKKSRSKYKYKSYRTTPNTGNIESLRQALGLKISTVVIDPGHGGHDPGAIGPSGLKEKNVNLKIAKSLKKILEKEGKEIGIQKVYLTRSSDRFIPLEERTAIAKKLKADLFISIHCNASKDRRAHGIETYILSFTNDKKSLEVAARENATTTKRLSDLEDIIQKYLLNSKIEESERFAQYVQSSIYSNVSRKYNTRNKGVKRAPFIVLIGADIPSILVESSFITNPTEEKRLKNQRYIDKIAGGIFLGVEQYASEIETAYLAY